MQGPEDGWLGFGSWRGDGGEKGVCGVGEVGSGVGLGEGGLGVNDA
jgi:hypothetical protein